MIFNLLEDIRVCCKNYDTETIVSLIFTKIQTTKPVKCNYLP